MTLRDKPSAARAPLEPSALLSSQVRRVGIALVFERAPDLRACRNRTLGSRNDETTQDAPCAA